MLPPLPSRVSPPPIKTFFYQPYEKRHRLSRLLDPSLPRGCSGDSGDDELSNHQEDVLSTAMVDEHFELQF